MSRGSDLERRYREIITSVQGKSDTEQVTLTSRDIRDIHAYFRVTRKGYKTKLRKAREARNADARIGLGHIRTKGM